MSTPCTSGMPPSLLRGRHPACATWTTNSTSSTENGSEEHRTYLCHRHALADSSRSRVGVVSDRGRPRDPPLARYQRLRPYDLVPDRDLHQAPGVGALVTPPKPQPSS